MNTDKILALAKLVEGMNDYTFTLADAERDKVLAKTGDKALARTVWMRVASLGLDVTTAIAEKLAEIGDGG